MMEHLKYLNIDIEKLVEEDPLKLLARESNETAQKRYGKYYKLFEEEISKMLANKALRVVSRSTSDVGISATFADLQNSYHVIVSEYTRKNEGKTSEEFRIFTTNEDFLFELSKNIIDKINSGINNYLKIIN